MAGYAFSAAPGSGGASASAAAIRFRSASVPGTISGLVAGFVRIALGAHFLSDVVFAGLFMALTVLALRRLIGAPRRSHNPSSVGEAVAEPDGQRR